MLPRRNIPLRAGFSRHDLPFPLRRDASMSVAFTKEGDSEAFAADLLDRPISPHPNLVTPEGLAQIEAAFAEARAAYSAAQAGGDVAQDRTAMARATRDLRYWSA